MKNNIYIPIFSILILYILFFPETAIDAASKGLVLWYTKMLPTLLPFSILSYIFVNVGILKNPLLAGFLFGFPLGSKITAQLVETNLLSKEKGNRLFSICNNISPVFITEFILHTSLHRPDLKVITLLILYLPPFIYYIVDTMISYKNTTKKTKIPYNHKKKASRSQINFKIIDAGIMNGFETLTKLGGYIMLFAIFAEMTTYIPFPHILLNCLLIGLTELTNGISYISNAPLSFTNKYILIIICTAFGGCSGIAQTASMIKKTGFSMKKYVKTKLICSLASGTLAFIYIYLFF